MNKSGMTANAKNALLSLLLLLPMPSLAVVVGMMVLPNTPVGQGFFAFGKVWVLLLPLVWVVLIEKEKLPLAKPSTHGLLPGVISGLLIGLLIVGAYYVTGRTWIDPGEIQAMASRVGLDSKGMFITMAAYWTIINSLLEEYVWRWFVVRQFRVLLAPTLAIIASALGFTLHHIVATQIYFPWPIVVLASVSIFVGGVIWSWFYLRYRSIWPSYVSHAIVDLVIFALAYQIIFSAK